MADSAPVKTPPSDSREIKRERDTIKPGGAGGEMSNHILKLKAYGQVVTGLAKPGGSSHIAAARKAENLLALYPKKRRDWQHQVPLQ